MTPFETIRGALSECGIDDCAAIPLSAVKIQKKYLLDRFGLSPESACAVMAVIPYYTPFCEGDRNISAYAVGKDYHLFWKNVCDAVLPGLKVAFPLNTFVGFTDHSPLAEVNAAACAGLGFVGDNGLLITPKYASCVFIASIITDAPCEDGFPAAIPQTPPTCPHCGACRRACPTGAIGRDGKDAVCLSALTQKKGVLSIREEELLRESGSVWGCDVCQEVCPFFKKAKKENTIITKIPFFYDDPLPCLTQEVLDRMEENAAKERAWFWHGRSVPARNAALIAKNDRPKEDRFQ